MSTESKFAFPKTAIIIFCLIYLLNIPRNNQKPLSFSLLLFSLASYLASYISANGKNNL